MAQNSRGKLLFNDFSKPYKCKRKVPKDDSLAAAKYFEECIVRLRAKGYLTARIDSVNLSVKPKTAYGYRGNLYRWARVMPDSFSTKELERIGVDVPELNGEIINPKDLVDFTKKTLTKFENSGYPFASVSLNNSSISDSSVTCNIIFSAGPFISFDTLYIKGSANVAQKFIESYLGLEKGDMYRELPFKKFDNKLKLLPFISLIKPSEVDFVPGKARLYSYLNRKRANRFSGLVGFRSGDESNSGLKITGNVSLQLINALKNAESFSLRWTASGEGSQKLNIEAAWPYPQGTSLNFTGSFSLYKRDSSFLTINPVIGLGFFLQGGGKIEVGYNYRESTTISGSNVMKVKNYSTNLVNLSFDFSNLPLNFLPEKGLDINLKLGMGLRRVSDTSLQNGESKSSYGELSFSNNFFVPVFRDLIFFHTKIHAKKAAILYSQAADLSLLDNELFLIGGNETLRGFNEESILADGYAILRSEVHFKASSMASLFMFFDKSVVFVPSIITTNYFWTTGSGLGFLVENKAGLFNISYAIGEGFGQKFNFRNAKVHAGFTANF